MDYIYEKINEFNRLYKSKEDNVGRLNELAEYFIKITKDTYDKIAIDYLEKRSMEVDDYDLNLWNILFKTISENMNIPLNEIKMLDVGTGNGRDIKFATSKGINIIGIDNSDGVISVLKNLEKNNIIPSNSFKKADMLCLPFQDESFNIVRQHASLLHVPMTAKGFMLDKVISENYRVLKKEGLLYIFIKKGDGISYIDTKEGLGTRIFQLHNKETIIPLLETNGFKILRYQELIKETEILKVEHILVIAKKI